MSDNQKDIEHMLEGVTFDDAPYHGHQDVLEKKLLLNFNAARSRRSSKWRVVMTSKIAKLAAAAMIVIGVFVGYEIFTGTSSVSWAEVLERVAAVRAVVYKAEVTGSKHGHPFEHRIEAVQSDDYGTRMDAYMGDILISRQFMLTGENAHITVFPDQKKYLEVELTEQIRRQNGDPKIMVEEFLRGNYKELGRSEINGIAVEGVESTDISPTAGFPGGAGLVREDRQFLGQVVGRLWVDVATGWPVEVTLEITDDSASQQMTIVVSDFQWEAQVDPETFTSVIPDGFTLMYTVQAGRLESGEQIVDGLRYFAKLSGGKYPAKFTIPGILGELGDLVKTHSSDPSFQFDDLQGVNLKYGAQYAARLEAEGKEPMYYGQTVTAADAGKVLLLWKLDDGNYRVIFGDLRIEDVSPSELAKLEAQ